MRCEGLSTVRGRPHGAERDNAQSMPGIIRHAVSTSSGSCASSRPENSLDVGLVDALPEWGGTVAPLSELSQFTLGLFIGPEADHRHTSTVRHGVTRIQATLRPTPVSEQTHTEPCTMGRMASPPEAHNSAQGAVYGQLLQVHDIHGDITVNPPRTPATVADVSLDPPRPATPVRGRDGLLETLRNAMVRGAPVPHVLTGPGGFGKTTVAAALAEHARAEGRTVFWVRPDAILPSMLEVAVEMGASRTEAEQVKSAPRSAARWVWRHLDAAPRPWLLVLDNADRPELLDPENRPGEQRGWMRSSPGGFVLVTSRVNDPALWAPAKVHRVEVLPRQDANLALNDHAGAEDVPGTEALAERLGGVPIALALAGRILATHGLLFPDARSLLERLKDGVTGLDTLASPLVAGANSERKLLSEVWALSLRLVGERFPKAGRLLKFLALLGPGGMRVSVRRLAVSALRGGVLDDPSSPLDEATLARSINALIVQGLVRSGHGRGGPEVHLHPLVAETVSEGLTPSDAPLLDEVASLLRRQNGRDPFPEATARLGLLRHRVRTRPSPPTDDTRVREAMEIVRLLNLAGEHEEAESVGRRFVRESEQHLGPTHAGTLGMRHGIAEALLQQGELARAEAAYRDLLEANLAVHGAEHDATLDVRFMLALMPLRRGEWEATIAAFRPLIATGTHRHGPENERVLLARENVAFALMHLGEVRRAQDEFRAVREIRLRTLDVEHPLVAMSDYYLGRAALMAGDGDRAGEHLRRCVEVRERTLGHAHPDAEDARGWLERVNEGAN